MSPRAIDRSTAARRGCRYSPRPAARLHRACGGRGGLRRSARPSAPIGVGWSRPAAARPPGTTPAATWDPLVARHTQDGTRRACSHVVPARGRPGEATDDPTTSLAATGYRRAHAGHKEGAAPGEPPATRSTHCSVGLRSRPPNRPRVRNGGAGHRCVPMPVGRLLHPPRVARGLRGLRLCRDGDAGVAGCGSCSRLRAPGSRR